MVEVDTVLLSSEPDDYLDNVVRSWWDIGELPVNQAPSPRTMRTPVPAVEVMPTQDIKTKKCVATPY